MAIISRNAYLDLGQSKKKTRIDHRHGLKDKLAIVQVLIYKSRAFSSQPPKKTTTEGQFALKKQARFTAQ